MLILLGVVILVRYCFCRFAAGISASPPTDAVCSYHLRRCGPLCVFENTCSSAFPLPLHVPTLGSVPLVPLVPLVLLVLWLMRLLLLAFATAAAINHQCLQRRQQQQQHPDLRDCLAASVRSPARPHVGRAVRPDHEPVSGSHHHFYRHLLCEGRRARQSRDHLATPAASGTGLPRGPRRLGAEGAVAGRS